MDGLSFCYCDGYQIAKNGFIACMSYRLAHWIKGIDVGRHAVGFVLNLSNGSYSQCNDIMVSN
jgi:hypothetical protein